MKKAGVTLFLLVTVTAALFLQACGGGVTGGDIVTGETVENSTEPGGGEEVTMKLSGIRHFLLEDHSGRYGAFRNSYEVNAGEDGVEVRLRLEGASEEEAVVIRTDEAFLKRLEELLNEHRVDKWNGFDKNNKRVLDGDSFSLSIRMENGKELDARGYAVWPKNYKEVLEAVEKLFMELNEQ